MLVHFLTKNMVFKVVHAVPPHFLKNLKNSKLTHTDNNKERTIWSTESIFELFVQTICPLLHSTSPHTTRRSVNMGEGYWHGWTVRSTRYRFQVPSFLPWMVPKQLFAYHWYHSDSVIRASQNCGFREKLEKICVGFFLFKDEGKPTFYFKKWANFPLEYLSWILKTYFTLLKSSSKMFNYCTLTFPISSTL